MAMRPEVRYINAYVSGTAAPQPEKKPQRRPLAKLPPVKKVQQKPLLKVDVVAVAGIVAALVLSVMLVVGLVQLNQAKQEAKQLRQYTETLQSQNVQLQDTYNSGYDLEEVQSIAQAMGMIPAEQAPHIQMQVIEPKIVQEPTAWESFWTFLTGMFA